MSVKTIVSVVLLVFIAGAAIWLRHKKKNKG